MKKYFLIAIFSFFVFGASLQSCHKSTCPTYATSKPTKGTKKAIKKARGAYDKGNAKKDRKTAKGKASSGL